MPILVSIRRHKSRLCLQIKPPNGGFFVLIPPFGVLAGQPSYLMSSAEAGTLNTGGKDVWSNDDSFTQGSRSKVAGF